MPICGVLGWPVSHSRSPALHEAGYRALGLGDWRYQLLPVPPELFEETVRGLPGAGFVGANVTIPHKQAALALADDATPAARAIGAANTLTFGDDGAIHADNTDAPGLLDALPFDPAGRTAVVLGAGGSARAVVWALVQGGADVQVWNRTPERAERLCREIGGRPAQALPPAADLLVNTTSVGLRNEDPFKALPLSVDAIGGYPCLVDLVYAGSGPTALVSAAQAAGATVVDGLEILVRQGARSFERWTGQTAPLDVLRAAVRAEPARAA